MSAATLVTADWHHTEKPKDRYRFDAMDFICQLIDKHEVKQLVMLGDLAHNKDHHPAALVNDIVDLLYDISKTCDVYVDQGNHDIAADTPFFQFVRWLPDVHWIRRPTFRHLDGIGPVGFLPHTRDYEKDWKDLYSRWEGCAIIFAHNAFEGAISETGKKLERTIPLNIFPPGIQIISGDVHKPQKYGDLIYVGAPYTQKYGDDYEPRVLLIQDGKIESIEVPGPQKRLFEVSSLEELDENLLECSQEDMIKVRYHLKTADRDKWPELVATVKKHNPGVILQPILEKRELARLPVQSSKNDKELVKEYGKQQKLSPEAMVTGYELINEH